MLNVSKSSRQAGKRTTASFAIKSASALLVLSFSIASAGFVASADVYASALNANQSLALFGTSIPATYYNGVGVDSCTFEYVGNTFDVKQYAVDLHNAGGNGTYPPNFDIGGRGTWLTSTLGGGLYDDQNTPLFFNDDFIRSTNYLIYRCSFESGLPASATNFDFQIQVNSSIGIDAQAIAFSCLWTAPDGLSRRDGNNTSHLYLYDASGYPAGEIASVIGGRPGNGDWANRYWLGHVGVYLSDALNYNGGGDADPKIFLINNQPAFCGCFVRAGDVTTEDAEPISFNGFRLNCKNVDKYFKYNFDYPNSAYVADGTTRYVYLLIQCPWVYGDFVLPEPEDKTTLGDINDNISDLVLSTDELRQILLRMESTQNDILTVERAHTAQFIDIIDKLNKIYNRMAESGEISPELVDAQALTRYDSTGYFSAMQAGKPSANAIANFAAPIGAVGGVFSNLVSRAGVGAMAGVCVSLLVLQWVLKRGRGD